MVDVFRAFGKQHHSFHYHLYTLIYLDLHPTFVPPSIPRSFLMVLCYVELLDAAFDWKCEVISVCCFIKYY